MFVRSPWSLARRSPEGRHALLLLIIAALLYSFGMHAARACMPAPRDRTISAVHDDPCHGATDIGQAACEAHCRTDVQSGRTTLGFDLPAAAPVDFAATLTTLLPQGPRVALPAALPRDTGPPLHILLHRLLR